MKVKFIIEFIIMILETLVMRLANKGLLTFDIPLIALSTSKKDNLRLIP